jgi:hypothetical protein
LSCNRKLQILNICIFQRKHNTSHKYCTTLYNVSWTSIFFIKIDNSISSTNLTSNSFINGILPYIQMSNQKGENMVGSTHYKPLQGISKEWKLTKWYSCAISFKFFHNYRILLFFMVIHYMPKHMTTTIHWNKEGGYCYKFVFLIVMAPLRITLLNFENYIYINQTWFKNVLDQKVQGKSTLWHYLMNRNIKIQNIFYTIKVSKFIQFG